MMMIWDVDVCSSRAGLFFNGNFKNQKEKQEGRIIKITN
jgi:hypothetical protein